MKEVIATRYVNAPPAHIFDVVADPHKTFLTSNPFVRMDIVGERSQGTGTVYRWTFTFPLGIRFGFDEEVMEWVRPERFTYRAISSWEMEATTALAPENGGTRVTFTLHYTLPGPWGLLVPEWLERLGTGRAVGNIKRFAEAQAPTSALIDNSVGTMTSRTLSKILAAFLLFDGVALLVWDGAYVRLWRVGRPTHPYWRAMEWLAQRPRRLLRTIGLVEAGFGLVVLKKTS